ncbi:imelysin family protein [soil metagenome]
MRRRDVLILLALAPVAMPARADTAPVLKRIVDEFIFPRYRTLLSAAAAQTQAWQAYCPAPSDAGAAGLRDAYRATADAWSAIEFLHYGPVSENFRTERLSYWPERKNATAKALAALLAGSNTADLTPAKIREASVAAQGLPALERLLFDEDGASHIAEARHCAVGTAIAMNIEDLAREIVAGWETLAPKLDAQEATARFVTDLLSLFEVMRDQKLRPVLGSDAANAKPRLAEGWRSGRPVRALSLNLESVGAATRIIVEATGKSGLLLPRAITTARSLVDAIHGDLGAMAADGKTRPPLEHLMDAVTVARDLALTELPAALGITLGFNSLDGD